MKGIGATISGLIISIMIIITMIFIIFLLIKNSDNERKLNLEEAEIIRTKNLFYLFNRSLATTWHVSSVQVVFNSRDVQDYWYKTDPSKPRDVIPSIGFVC